MRIKQVIQIVLSCFLLIATALHAQEDKMLLAQNYIRSAKADSAQLLIDQVVLNSETSNNATAWYLRGYIYKEQYKQKETLNKRSPLRLEAIKSFQQSLKLDSTKENKNNNNQNLKYLASRLYQDGGLAINPTNPSDTADFKTAEDNYAKYKEVMQQADPAFNEKLNDIVFYRALGSRCSALLDSKRFIGNASYFERAKSYYDKVLVISPNDTSANYNMGILYYNKAVSMIVQSEYDIDLVSLDGIQEEAVVLAKKALPYVDKAYTLAPFRKEILMSLSGIYFIMNDKEKSDEFKRKLESLQNQNDK